MDISLEKKALRSHALALRQGLDLGEISQKITTHIISSEAYKEANSLFVYYSTEEEINTISLVKQAFIDKKQVYIPKILGKGQMSWSPIEGDTALTKNHYGIFEAETQVACPVGETIDLALVPCLMADRKGYRLGYGGGFYDRFLTNFKGRSMVLCARALLREAVPTEAYDIACQMVVTEGGFATCLPILPPF